MSAEHFDAVVIGSGFGRAVTAYRMAEAGRKVLLRERTRLPHERAFKLLDDVDVEGISANLASGVLTVRLPKKPEPGSRKIPVGLVV